MISEEKFIYYARQSINKKDINIVSKSLKKRLITQNDDVYKFENDLKKYTKSKYCIVVNSATSALHVAYSAMGLDKNSYIVTSPISFVSTANAAHFCNSRVEFVDINSKNFCLDPKILDQYLNNKTKKKLPLPKIIVNVHLGGNASNSKEIYKIANKFKIKVVEDASHSLGSISNDNKVGSCKYAETSITSFHPIKSITTGEGGCIFTNNKQLYEKMKLLREHHLVRQKKNFWKYTQNGLGYNFRMSGLNASLGRSQLTKIDKFIKKRNIIASHYIKKLKDLPIIFQINSPNNISSYHLFIIQITNSNNKKINQSNLFYFLKKNNVICALHYPRIDKQPFYKYSYNKNLINADFYEKSSISLPIYYDLKKNHQDKIINLILSFFNKIS